MQSGRYSVNVRITAAFDDHILFAEVYDAADLEYIDYLYYATSPSYVSFTAMRHNFDVDRVVDQIEWLRSRRASL